MLRRAKARGKAILVVEYLSGSETTAVGAELRGYGFVPSFASRGL